MFLTIYLCACIIAGIVMIGIGWYAWVSDTEDYGQQWPHLKGE